MSYGSSAVRFDMGKEARIRVCQHFGIPGALSPPDIVKYLLPIRLKFTSTHVLSRFQLLTGCWLSAHTTMVKLTSRYRLFPVLQCYLSFTLSI